MPLVSLCLSLCVCVCFRVYLSLMIAWSTSRFHSWSSFCSLLCFSFNNSFHISAPFAVCLAMSNSVCLSLLPSLFHLLLFLRLPPVMIIFLETLRSPAPSDSIKGRCSYCLIRAFQEASWPLGMCGKFYDHVVLVAISAVHTSVWFLERLIVTNVGMVRVACDCVLELLLLYIWATLILAVWLFSMATLIQSNSSLFR